MRGVGRLLRSGATHEAPVQGHIANTTAVRGKFFFRRSGACAFVAMMLAVAAAGEALAQFPGDAAQPGAGGQSSSSIVQPSPQAPLQSSDTNNDAGYGARFGSAYAPMNPQLPASLTTAQIASVLQRNADAMVEVKEYVADLINRDSTTMTVQSDEISDQTLYSDLANSAELRAEVTTFLSARGYVSDGEAASGNERPARQPMMQPRSSSARQGFPRADEARPAADAPYDGVQRVRDVRGDEEVGGESAQSGEPARRAMQPNARDTPQKPEDNTNASTDEPTVLRRPAPYNLRSMRDLYTQLPEADAPLRRFGTNVFLRSNAEAGARGASAVDTPLDVPLGPDYVLGVGDTLSIALWGGVTQNITRSVDRDGRVLLPEAGSLTVAGLTLERAQELIAAELKRQFRDAQVSVTVARVRSVRVYVVGDVQRPGGYDVSALATPLSALYAAGGPTAAGSLRRLRHMRGDRLVEEVDLYDFLLHGLRAKATSFESGDTLLIAPVGPLVAISGAVKRPAIYELRAADSSLASVIEDAGGFTAAAAADHIAVDRIDAQHQRVPVPAERGALATFALEDGDRVRVATILPYSERAIYLEGHVARPGRIAYSDGMKLSDVLRSYQDMLPEPAAHGEVVRLMPPDLHAETIDFSVPDVLVGNANLNLQPLDTVRVFGRYEHDAPRVTVSGEVQRPGVYPLSEGMTAAQLVRMAGGFRRDALLEKADLSSYTVVNGQRVEDSVAAVRIGAAVEGGDASADVRLKAGDVLTIHQVTGWSDIGEAVTIDGQVAHPGNYGFQEGERLSSVLRRAGGFRDTAYPEGAVLVRQQVRELEEKSRQELIRQIETSAAAARLQPNLASGDNSAMLQAIKAQQDEVLARLKSAPPTGRMVVQISGDIDRWSNTPADIELRKGDVLTVPKRPGFVLVSGQVYNPTAITFAPGKTAGWYLSHAGGANSTANRKEIFVIRANGSVVGRRSGGWLGGDVLSTKLNPGDVVVVPQKVIGASMFWRNLLTTAQLASSIAITAAVSSL